MNSISHPTLFTRLLLKLLKEEVETVEELQYKQPILLQTVEDNINSKPFDLNRFISTQKKSTQEQQEIRKSYKEFNEEVSIIANNSSQQNNASKTMYNIIARNNDVEDDSTKDGFNNAYHEAKSYFGHIPINSFQRVFNLGYKLFTCEKVVLEESRKYSKVRFGEDVTFKTPKFEALAIESIPSFTSNDRDFDNNDHLKINNTQNNNAQNNYEFIQWFIDFVHNYIQSHQIMIEPKDFFISLFEVCQSHANSPDMLQMKLFDLVGEDGFEFMFEIIEKRGQISQLSKNDILIYFDGELQHLSKNDNNIPSANNKNVIDYESLSANQKRKLVEKEKRELDRVMRESSKANSNLGNNNSTNNDWLQQLGFSEDFLLQERALGLQKNRNGENVMDENWLDNLAPAGTLEYHEKKSVLPSNAQRKTGPGFEEVHIPAIRNNNNGSADELVSINTLEDWAQLAFPNTKSLNRIQSKVFPTAYNSSENMLVCAPTGAGKTNIAMLTFLQLVKQSIKEGSLDVGNIKAVYIAPMKALAQEVVAKFSERLEPLGMIVREFTGDMQLTKQEVAESQILVSTPEKFDVITRKGGDGSLTTMVSLIIIDEVHLLAEDRGAVIETIVARMQRYVESSQKLVRIIGLSATLPNYQDVANFLHVNPKSGLFFFGPEFRPIPLDQTFVGITEKSRVKQHDAMNRTAYEKMVAALERGKQVMIFVHSRKETSLTAEAMADLSGKNGTTDLLENVHHEKYTLWKKQVEKSRSKEVQQLFYKGFGIHHAGLLRSDRSMTEQLFELGLIKVLCCTATLAWGVNLPAHTVIIKGTELYDPERGGFVDLSILDVFQIFGRAGRPQYDNSGHAILITPHKSLNVYLGMLTQQAPIESSLIKSLADHMNAEIVNGTINNIKEAASWLSYTFLFVRMCKNPLAYGLKLEEIFSDPRLERKRIELVKESAKLLDECMMIRYDIKSGNLGVTDLGRIASHYYIKYGTIQAFNNMLTPHLSDMESLHVLCSSAEFDSLKVRPEEISEIELLKKNTSIKLRGTSDDTSYKINILLQNYLNQSHVNSFTLQSDINYISQNASRITRALFEICLKRGWSTIASHYLLLCKSIDKRMKFNQTPLRQFTSEFPLEVYNRLEETESTLDRLLECSAQEISSLIHNQKLGRKVLQFIKYIPLLQINTQIQPITRGILKINISIICDFNWHDKYHGFSESFHLWIEDGVNEFIYHTEYFTIIKKQKDELKLLECTIPIREPLPPQYYIRILSDNWIGSDQIIPVSFNNLILPMMMTPHTNLLDIHPVPKSALQNKKFESLFPYFTHFNPIQSQTFHVLYHTNTNILVGAPT
eukprot:gene11120-14924_t